MKIFDIFKKKNNTCCKEQSLKDTIIKISSIISHNDNKAISEINNLISNKSEYINNNVRGIDENFDDNTIFWLIMVDTLIKYNYLCERDWKDGFADFIYSLSKLKDFDLDVNKTLFNKDDNITEWCKIIDSNYEPNCIGCIDIDSDSYVIFISNVAEISMLKELSVSVSKRIDYARNC